MMGGPSPIANAQPSFDNQPYTGGNYKGQGGGGGYELQP